MKAFKESEIKK